MPRRLKPVEIEVCRHPTLGARATIYYDRNNHDHYAEYGRDVYRDQDIQKLRNQLHAAMGAQAAIVWRPVISISERAPFQGAGGWPYIGVEVHRFFVGEMPSGEYRQKDWRDPGTGPQFGDEQEARDPSARSRQFYWPNKLGPFAPPCQHEHRHSNNTAPTRYLPYSEELWAGLEALVEAVRAMRRRLDELLLPANLAHLEAAGARRLLQLPATVIDDGPRIELDGEADARGVAAILRSIGAGPA